MFITVYSDSQKKCYSDIESKGKTHTQHSEGRLDLIQNRYDEVKMKPEI